MNFEKMPVDFGDNYLWKYMDIHKFLYLIREQNLFFTRLDGFEDSIEGVSEKLLKDRAQIELFLKIKNPNQTTPLVSVRNRDDHRHLVI